MMLFFGRPDPDDAIKILNVLGDDRPTLSGAIAKEFLVG
jgi:hypothetical protein